MVWLPDTEREGKVYESKGAATLMEDIFFRMISRASTCVCVGVLCMGLNKWLSHEFELLGKL